jgi:hypothetical protein
VTRRISSEPARNRVIHRLGKGSGERGTAALSRSPQDADFFSTVTKPTEKCCKKRTQLQVIGRDRLTVAFARKTSQSPVLVVRLGPSDETALRVSAVSNELNVDGRGECPSCQLFAEGLLVCV